MGLDDLRDTLQERYPDLTENQINDIVNLCFEYFEMQERA